MASSSSSIIAMAVASILLLSAQDTLAQCTGVNADGQQIDLGALKMANLSVTDSQGEYTYTFNPCTTFSSDDGNCTDVNLCRTTAVGSISVGIGKEGKFQPFPNKPKTTAIMYEQDGIQSMVILMCDSTKTSPKTVPTSPKTSPKPSSKTSPKPSPKTSPKPSPSKTSPKPSSKTTPKVQTTTHNAAMGTFSSFSVAALVTIALVARRAF